MTLTAISYKKLFHKCGVCGIYMKRYKIAMLAVSLLILLAIVIYANPVVIASHIAQSDYKFIFAGFVVAFITMLLGVLKWKVMLKGVSLVELFPVQVLGYTISNFTPGKAAEPAKAVLLKIRKGIPVSSSLASIIWERVADVVALILFSILAVTSLAVGSFFWLSIAGIAFFVIIITVSFAVLYSRNFGMKLFRLIRKLPVLKRLPENFMDLFYKVKIGRSKLAQCFVIAFVTWAIEGVVLYCALAAFGIFINPVVLAGIVALSVVIGIASSLPGGLGTTEVVMIFLLGLVGVESSIAATAAIIFRFMTIWFVNLLGGLSFIYLSRKFDLKNIF